jgi:carboxyl-terminal processing protease
MTDSDPRALEQAPRAAPPSAAPPGAAPPSAAPPAPARGPGLVAWVVSVALAAVVGALLFAGGWLAAGGSGGQTSCAAPAEAFEAFCEAYQRVKTEHVDDWPDEDLVEGAIRGMFQYGIDDPNSGYMAPEQYQQALGDLSGKFSGIGAEMSIKHLTDPAKASECTEFNDVCALVVVAPLAGSPAEAAGLQAGDVVRAVDGESVSGTTMSDQIGQIRGEEGTDVTLTIERDGEDEPFDLTITRAEIVIQEVATRMIEGHIGYIELNGFSEAAAEQFRTGLEELLAEGADQIVFDLRDNPGGYIEAAQEIASQFIESGVIFTQESSGDEVRTWEATGDGVAIDTGIPVVVLVNGGSASASEIVAAALKEAGRATLVGESTFGKNTVQVWSRLVNDGGVRITISRWFTPQHNTVAPDGIQPDVVATRTEETPPEQDVVLEAALDVLADRAIGGEGRSPVPQPSSSPSAAAPLPAASSVVGIVGPIPVC